MSGASSVAAPRASVMVAPSTFVHAAKAASSAALLASGPSVGSPAGSTP